MDLFKGEQQKNVDFAFMTALNVLGIDPDQGVLFIYDIVCQYIIHLKDRIGHLLPPGLVIDQAIDSFHVHAHKDDCFFRFVTTFIPGAAIVAGQILESLWSNLNSISPTVRTATLPHRAEMLDDHACDSNHKKMLSMTENLRVKYMDATTTSSQTDLYYLDVSRTVDQSTLTAWEDEVKAAEASRRIDIKVMDVYAARLPDQLGIGNSSASASAMATATTSQSASRSVTEYGAIEQWMEFALIVEENQYVALPLSRINSCNAFSELMFKTSCDVWEQMRSRMTSRSLSGNGRIWCQCS